MTHEPQALVLRRRSPDEVEVVEAPPLSSITVELLVEDGGTGLYRIFVVADAVEINVAEFVGSDGNGYYGTGFELVVVRPRG